MAWCNDVTFKFINLYRSHPAVWNPKIPSHKDKNKVNEAWDRISDEMNVPVEVLKKKKETLMAAFRLNHKKKLASLKTGDPRHVFNPVWVFYEPMAEFLSELYDYKSGNVYSDDGASSSMTFQEKWNPVVEVGVEELSNVESFDEDQPARKLYRCESFDEDQPARKRYRGESPEPVITPVGDKYLANTMTTLANVINIISKEIVGREKEKDNEDECSLYGKLTAMKLREMPVAERRELMYEVDTLFIQKSFKRDPL